MFYSLYSNWTSTRQCSIHLVSQLTWVHKGISRGCTSASRAVGTVPWLHRCCWPPRLRLECWTWTHLGHVGSSWSPSAPMNLKNIAVYPCGLLHTSIYFQSTLFVFRIQTLGSIRFPCNVVYCANTWVDLVRWLCMWNFYLYLLIKIHTLLWYLIGILLELWCYLNYC